MYEYYYKTQDFGMCLMEGKGEGEEAIIPTDRDILIVGDDIFVMLLVEKFFKTFTKKEICDASKSTEVILCLSAESRDSVDEMVKRAVEAGGTTPMAKQDQGWMYGHGFQDIDGHLWEIMYMDMSAMPKDL